MSNTPKFLSIYALCEYVWKNGYKRKTALELLEVHFPKATEHYYVLIFNVMIRERLGIKPQYVWT